MLRKYRLICSDLLPNVEMWEREGGEVTSLSLHAVLRHDEI